MEVRLVWLVIWDDVLGLAVWSIMLYRFFTHVSFIRDERLIVVLSFVLRFVWYLLSCFSFLSFFCLPSLAPLCVHPHEFVTPRCDLFHADAHQLCEKGVLDSNFRSMIASVLYLVHLSDLGRRFAIKIWPDRMFVAKAHKELLYHLFIHIKTLFTAKVRLVWLVIWEDVLGFAVWSAMLYHVLYPFQLYPKWKVESFVWICIDCRFGSALIVSGDLQREGGLRPKRIALPPIYSY